MENCQFFLENGVCTLGAACPKNHDRNKVRVAKQRGDEETKEDGEITEKGKEEKEEEETDIVEICFSFDTTGSMYSWLDEVRREVSKIVENLFAHDLNIRISIIAHGDYCDEHSSYVLKYIEFTKDKKALIRFIREAGATGGGDFPECYELVLYTAVRMNWTRRAKSKALVIIGDAPPHEADYPQNKLNINWREELDRLAMMGIVVFGVHCGSASKNFYEALGKRTGGRYLPLRNMENITHLFTALCLRQSSREKFLAFSEELHAKGIDKEFQGALESLTHQRETSGPAVRRLMKDLRELRHNQLSHLAAVPERDNVFRWHVNIKPEQGPFQGLYLHLVLEFPDDYPQRPPTIHCVSPFADDVHPFVFRGVVCSNMITSNVGADGEAGKKFGGWSAAYSIGSLLVNIGCLLANPGEEEEKKMAADEALLRAVRDTRCDACGHYRTTPYPPLLANESPVGLSRFDFVRGDELLETEAEKDRDGDAKMKDEERKEETGTCCLKESFVEYSGVMIAGNILETRGPGQFWKVRSDVPIQRSHGNCVWEMRLDWFEKSDLVESGFVFGFATLNDWFAGFDSEGRGWDQNNVANSVLTHAFEAGDRITCVIVLQDSGPDRMVVCRNGHVKGSVAIPMPEWSKEHNAFYPCVFLKDTRVQLCFDEQPFYEQFSLAYSFFAPVNIVRNLPELTALAKRAPLERPKEWEQLSAKALSGNVLVELSYYLLYEDLVHLAQVCRYWSETFERFNVLERHEMVCFFTKENFRDTILGVGLEVTHNPSKEKAGEMGDWIKTIKSESDLMSVIAWDKYEIREGAWGERLTHFLPLVINPQHATRAREEMMKRLAMVCNSDMFSEQSALLALTATMNQFVVQLMAACDGSSDVDAMHASEKALVGYCGFHHLLLWMSKEFPVMRQIAARNVLDFLSDGARRRKSGTPDLGKFLVNLVIVPDEERLSWEDLALDFVLESLDRKVKWYLQKDKSLEDMALSCKDRLKRTLELTRVGRRLILFQLWFLRHVARPERCSLDDILRQYNERWGRPTNAQKGALLRAVRRILTQEDSWLLYFERLGLGDVVDSEEQVHEILKECVVRSHAKGYHKKNKKTAASDAYRAVSRVVQQGIEAEHGQRDRPAVGPLARLADALECKSDVLVYMKNDRRLTGRLVTFDRHWNLVLTGAKEYWRECVFHSKTEPKFAEKDRILGTVFVRGDDVIVVNLPDELPEGDEDYKYDEEDFDEDYDDETEKDEDPDDGKEAPSAVDVEMADKIDVRAYA